MHSARMKAHRILLFIVGASALAAPLVFAANPITDDLKQGGFAIGPQAYSFNRFTAFEAIEKAQAAGAKCIEFYPGQKLSPEKPEAKLHHTMSDEDFAALQAKL